MSGYNKIKICLDKFVKDNYNTLIQKVIENSTFFYANKNKDIAVSIINDTYVHLSSKIEKNTIAKTFITKDEEWKTKYFLRTAKNLIIDKFRSNKIISNDETENILKGLSCEQKEINKNVEDLIRIIDNEESLFINFLVYIDNIKYNKREKKRLKDVFSDKYLYHLQRFILNPDYFIKLNVIEKNGFKKRIKHFLNTTPKSIF